MATERQPNPYQPEAYQEPTDRVVNMSLVDAATYFGSFFVGNTAEIKPITNGYTEDTASIDAPTTDPLTSIEIGVGADVMQLPVGPDYSDQDNFTPDSVRGGVAHQDYDLLRAA